MVSDITTAAKTRLISRGVLIALLFAVLASAKKPIPWETGRVVSQDISSETVGAHPAPYFGVGTPRTVLDSTATNKVVVDVGTIRYTWNERFVVYPVILTVNTDIQFYRDNDLFVVMDAKKKAHRFSLVGMTKLPEPTKQP